MSESKPFEPAMQQAVYKAIFERRDMRHFNGAPVDAAIMNRLFEAAHAAPSVGFMQPWRFIRIHKTEVKQQLHALVEQEANATAEQLDQRKEAFVQLKVQGILDCSEVVVVSLMEQRERHVFGRRTMPEMDLASASAAIQNMWLAARAEGIGLGWVSLFEPQALKTLLKMPADTQPIAILCIGHVDAYYDEPMLIQENWAKRGDLKNYIMDDAWDCEKEKKAQQQWD